MEPATTLAIIILIVAILILIYYYLQATNNPVYENIHSQANDFSARVSQEEYISNISDKMNDFGEKLKDRVQEEEDEDHISRTDAMSNKINQFINEQSEQVINDWDLATNKDINKLLDKYDDIKSDLDEYKEFNDKRVDTLEERVNKLDEDLKSLKK